MNKGLSSPILPLMQKGRPVLGMAFGMARCAPHIQSSRLQMARAHFEKNGFWMYLGIKALRRENKYVDRRAGEWQKTFRLSPSLVEIR